MTHRTSPIIIAALALGLAASGCGPAEKAADASPTATADAASLPTLIPAPADTRLTKGPDGIADGGIHLHYQVDGSPNDVMPAYKSALQDKGWAVTTIISSTGAGGGGATYTGIHGEAYGVFDGGGFENNTFIDVCAWPSKPADPNCSRGDR